MMHTSDEGDKGKTRIWEILMIILIWLLAASLVYIVFWKAKIELKY